MHPGATFTYEADFSTARDRIRRLLPDVDAANPHLSDEEIAWFGGNDGATKAEDYAAASAAAEAIANAALVDVTSGDDSVKLSQAYERWMTRATELTRLARKFGGAKPWAGGIARSDVAARQADRDRVAPAFDIDLHTVPSNRLGGYR